MSFRLIAILWSVAVVAVSVATFGPEGVLLAAMVIIGWRTELGLCRSSCLEWSLCAVGVMAYMMVVLIFLRPGAEYGRRETCGNNLRQLAKAVTIRSESSGTLLPAAQPGLDGAGPQSWRVALLPMLEEHALHDSYRRDKSWDGPFNRSLSRKAPLIYRCPSAHDRGEEAFTNYFAVVGEHTAWPPDRGRPIGEITDDASTTILVIECAGRNTPWSKPEDLTFDEALELLTNPPEGSAPHEHPRTTAFFHKSDEGPSLHVAFADGGIRALDLPLSKELATALLTVDGGETIDEQDFDRRIEPQLDVAKIVFFVLAALPNAGRFFRRKPESAAPPDDESAAN